MANLLQTLTPILLLLLAAAPTARPQTSSTSFFYDFCGPQSTGLTFQGDTKFVTNATFPWNSTFLRLTSANHAVVGRVLYSHPVQFWQAGGGQIDFDTTFSFYITPNLGHSAADGIAFFIAPVGSQIPSGAGGANFGVFDGSGRGANVFAAEFDTFINTGWDPNYRHVGIDLGSWTSSNTTNVGNSIVGREVTARVTYSAATKLISVAVSAGWQRFDVSLTYDLSKFLPQQVQVGLSASTGLSGNYISTHDVKTWYFTATMVNSGNGEPRIREVV